MGDDEIEEARRHRFTILVEDHQEVGGERHHLEKDEEPEGVIRRDHQHHRGDEQVHEEAHRADAAPLIFAHIGQRIDRSDQRQQRNHADQQGRQRIQPQYEMREGEGRGDVNGVRGTGQRGKPGHEAEQRAERAGEAGDIDRGAVMTAEQQAGEGADGQHRERGEQRLQRSGAE